MHQTQWSPERPHPPPVSLASQSHHEKPPDNATDLADYLVKKGLPFRETHAISGKLVHYCIENGISLLDVSLDKLKEFSPAFEEDVYDAISLKTCVEGRSLIGGPAPDTVKKYLDNL